MRRRAGADGLRGPFPDLVERAARRFSETLDLALTLERAAAAFVPELAELCLVFSFEPEGRLKVRAVAAEEPRLRAAAERLLREPSTFRPTAPPLVRSAGPVHGRVDAETIRAEAGGPAEAALAELLGTVWRTWLPLRSHDGPWGMAVLLSRATGPGPDPAAVRVAQELGDRAGQALTNASRFAQAVAAQARFAAAFENAPSGMLLVRADPGGVGRITAANPAMAAILGVERDALLGADLVDLHHSDERAVAVESVSWLAEAPERYAAERRFRHADGRDVWVHVRAARLEAEDTPHVVVQVQDITERKRHAEQLQFLADHDPLTGLYNRRRFAEELDWVLAFSRRYGTPAAVLIVDVDSFKFVNDTHGHAIGDEVLRAVGETLRSRCRETDIVGRLGGDEFGVILPQCNTEEADLVARSLLDAVREHARVGHAGREVRATASIGVRLIGPDTAWSAEELMSDADIALYDAKEAGRDRLSVTGDGGAITDRLRERLAWSERIRDALSADGFVLFEQPIVRIGSGDVAGSEILLRMQGSDGEIIPPARFLDVAERFGQIQAIDCWVIQHAVRLLAERQAAGIDLELEVNLSGGSLTDPTVVDFIRSEVRNAPIDATRLTFEVTETAAIENVARARTLAQHLADLGCRLALDDFGSGFGSFYYLKHLPFDVVKIDGEFIRGLVENAVDRLTVQAIVQIARGLGKPTIAEFVDAAATLTLLEHLGVDFAQGHHVGRPRPVQLNPLFPRPA